MFCKNCTLKFDGFKKSDGTCAGPMRMCLMCKANVDDLLQNDGDVMM